MNANLENKQLLVEEIKGKLKNAKSVVFTDYKGLNVAQTTKLRTEFRKNNAEYKVYKNRLLLRALNEMGMTGADVHLNGTTSVAFGYGDEVAPAKIVLDAVKETKKLRVKFGLFYGKLVDEQYVKTIATLPSKEILISQLLSVLNGPTSGLARALNAIAEKN